jgi:hypothetical protein
MNDPRIDTFLASLRSDLLAFFPAREAEERVREIAGHIEQAIADRSEEEDPVGTALAEFGEPNGYRKAAERQGEQILLRRPEREVVRLAALTLLVPIGLDVLMDLSSWVTGSDSSTWLVSVPLTAFLALRFVLASTRSRRFLFAPIAATTMVCFALYLALGGIARATEAPGGVGTRTRGTAYARRAGLIRDSLPAKEARLASVQRATRLFAEPFPTQGIGEFRAATGYLVPSIPERDRAIWKGDPAAGRWLMDFMRYLPVASYAGAKRVWQERAPEMLRYARLGVEGERNEIQELTRVVSCPWSVSVAAAVEPKTAMGIVALMGLLVLHGVGVLSGLLTRRNRQRRLV